MRKLSYILFLFIAIVTPPVNALTGADLQEFFSGLIPAYMAEHQIRGVAVSVVEHDELVYAAGFGHTDEIRHVPVSPEKSLFRIGSVTKVITALSVMQLVKEQELDLDVDISAYLDFSIPRAFPGDITLRHLLTHTAGFEDTAAANWSFTPVDLRTCLVDHAPLQVRPPGSLAAYSNYGFALAGHIVERVSGSTYDEYVQEQVFSPLGMRRSSSVQVFPELADAAASEGFLNEDGSPVSQELPHLCLSPAGDISSTAEDMGRLMKMFLALEESDVRYQMLTPQFIHDDRLRDHMCLGFYENHRNGMRILAHGGDTICFHSRMALFPDLGIGLFITSNSEGGVELGPSIVEAFADHLSGSPLPEISRRTPSFAPGAAYTGRYVSTRRSFSSPEKLLQLFSSLRVQSSGENDLLLDGPHGREVFRPAAEAVYEREEGQVRMVFSDDGYMYLDTAPFLAFEPLPWYETGTSVLILLSAGLLLGILRILMRSHLSRGSRLGGGVLLTAAVLQIATVLFAVSDTMGYLTGAAPAFLMLRITSWLFILGSAGMGCLTLQGWKLSSHRARQLDLSSLLIALCWIWSIFHWNLL